MNIFKRIYINLQRNLKKTLVLLLAFFLTMTLSSGAVSIRQAVYTTDRNLRSELPTIATIRRDQNAIRIARENSTEWIYIEEFGGGLIREIGSLPQVRAFNYTAWGHHFFSEGLYRVFLPEIILDYYLDNEMLSDWQSLRESGLSFENFTLKGIHYYNVLDIEAGLISLAEGRVFDEKEINNGEHVAIVSREFLNINNLHLGDSILFEHRIYQEPSAGIVNLHEFYSVDNLLLSTPFEFEIIGVFEYDIIPNSTDAFYFLQSMEILNRIYVPNKVVESTLPLYIQVFSETQPELLKEFHDLYNLEELIQYENMVFLLEDPLLLRDFAIEAIELLPDFWTVSDLSSSFTEISSSMENLNWISEILLVGSLVAAVSIVGLLTMLFLKERKNEIGIYLAIGTKKTTLILQLLGEVFTISILAIVLSLFSGHFISSRFAAHFLQQSLVSRAEDENFRSIEAGTPESMGFRFEMSMEEMLDNFDASLTNELVFRFLALSLFSVFISTLFPILYLFRLNPREILL